MVVYDLGAGTFDTAVLRFTGRAWEMLGTAEGADRIGGLAFDDVVAGMAVTAGHRLDADGSRRVKEALSGRPEVTIGGAGGITLRQAEFERRIDPLIAPTLEAVHRALRSAGVRSVDAILLAGGSTRIPLVTRRLEDEFGVVGLVLGLLTPLVVIVVFLVLSSR